ncbi:MAG: hypothetical protein ACYC35_26730 [Pirellulales bacterium]
MASSHGVAPNCTESQPARCAWRCAPGSSFTHTTSSVPVALIDSAGSLIIDGNRATVAAASSGNKWPYTSMASVMLLWRMTV